MNWEKAFILVDVSAPKDRDYWQLADYLRDNGWEFTDVNFGDDKDE